MELKQQVIKSSKWNTLATAFNIGFQFVKLIVLTRLLDKADFGLVAIATMVISFTSIFSDLGFTVAIIHKQDTTEEQYSSLYWANVLFSVILFSIVVCISPIVADFYHEEKLQIIVPLLSIEVLANAFGKMFQTLKMKNLDFKFISIVSVSCTILGFVVTVVLALCGLGVYSLVLGQLLQVSLTQLIYVIAGRRQMKIKFHFNLKEIKDYVLIGSYGLGAKVIDFAASKIDVFLIGRFFGMDALGVYNLAKELVGRIYNVLGRIFYNIGVSAFAIIQNNILAVKDNLCKVVNSISLITVPLYTILAIFADKIVPLIYSESFSEIVPLVRVLSIYGIVSSIEIVSASIRDAKGKTDYSLIWTTFLLIVTCFATVILRKTSIFYLASAVSFISVLTIIPFWYITVYKTAGISFKDFIKFPVKNLLIAIIPGIVVYLVRFNDSNLLAIVLFAVYCGIYLLLEYLFNRPIIRQLYNVAFHKK